MNGIFRLVLAVAFVALVAVSCSIGSALPAGGAGGAGGATNSSGAVGTVEREGVVVQLSAGRCSTSTPPTAATGAVAGATTLELRFDAAAGEAAGSSLVALLNVEPPVVTAHAGEVVQAELLIPLLMREAELALRVDGVDVAVERPTHNGYVSPDMRSGYISATTADGGRVAINFLCPELEAAQPE